MLEITPVTWHDGTFTCESEEKPDLVVDKSVEFNEDGKFVVSYTVTNIGDGPAGESTTCKYVDGELQETQTCPALAPDASHSDAFEPEECPCGETLNVTVCADNDDVVDESNETNNCEVNIVECPYIEVDIRADGIGSNIFDAADYRICPGTVTEGGVTIDLLPGQ
jgi:subtilase family serine protease